MTLAPDHVLVSGTALALEGKGVLLTGPSGSGKSDLAIRLIAAGWRLVSDDVVEVKLAGEGLLLDYPAAAPPDLRGKIEVRGLGITAVPAALGPVALALVIRLVEPEKVQRMPDLEHESYLGVMVRAIDLAPFEASSAAKVRLALDHDGGDIIAAP